MRRRRGRIVALALGNDLEVDLDAEHFLEQADASARFPDLQLGVVAGGVQLQGHAVAAPHDA